MTTLRALKDIQDNAISAYIESRSAWVRRGAEKATQFDRDTSARLLYEAKAATEEYYTERLLQILADNT